MEKLNLNFSGGDNVVKSICWIMSYLSWLLLVASGWASIKWLDEDFSVDDDTVHVGYTIWGFKALRTINGKDPLKEEYYDINCYYRWLLCIFLQNNL